jgi:predicted alpha/beta-fold hydrolase
MLLQHSITGENEKGSKTMAWSREIKKRDQRMTARLHGAIDTLLYYQKAHCSHSLFRVKSDFLCLNETVRACLSKIHSRRSSLYKYL